MLVDFTKLISALEGHTKALLAHAEALVSGSSETTAPRPRGRRAAGEVNGVAVNPIDAVAAATPAAAAVQAAVNAAPQTVTAAVDPKPVVTQPTLQQVADAIIALANSPTGGRDKAVAILSKYGVKKVPELKPENFVAVLADVTAANVPDASGGLI